MKPLGGSELLFNNLVKHTGTDWQTHVNLVMSFCTFNHIDPNRKNVIWQHLDTDQGALVGMTHTDFVSVVDDFVYVSDWQRQEFEQTFDVSHCRNHVIKNAIQPIEFRTKPQTGKIKLVYSSMPARGLEVLLDAVELLDRDDFELTVFSSNIIYGKTYAPQDNSEQLFHRARQMKNVVYRGYAMNQAVRKALQESHILAYPSVFRETSCLSAIEAGAAGCRIVTTEYGALPETCGGWARMIPYEDDHKSLARNYAAVLNDEIDNYQKNSYNIQEQSSWFNDYYSWTRRAEEWKTFFETLCVKS